MGGKFGQLPFERALPRLTGPGQLHALMAAEQQAALGQHHELGFIILAGKSLKLRDDKLQVLFRLAATLTL